MATALKDEELELFALLNGVQNARYLALSSFALLVYDYCLNLDREIKYFWSGPWSISRILYLFNRYFSPVVVILGAVCLFGKNLSKEFCRNAVPAVFTMDVIALAVIQAIIVLRIWYIFSQRRITRIVVVAIFLAVVVTTTSILGIIFPDFRQEAIVVPGLKLVGCSAPPSNNVWKLFLPNLILHTVLYAATTWPALRLHRQGRTSPFMNRMVKDGGIFYASVFVSAAFCTIGALQRDHPNVMIPAIYANFLLSLCSVSVSRIMLSIRSLAASLSMDVDMLLSDAELSRVHWRQGVREGELIVEIEAPDEDDIQLGIMDEIPYGRSHTPAIYATRVGVYDDVLMPGADKLPKDPTKRMSKKVPRVTSKASSRAHPILPFTYDGAS